MKTRNIVLFTVALLLADQIVKFWVKLHMTLDQSFTVFHDWFFIRFIENPGAAFGFQLGGDYGKLILSLFRIVAVGAIIWYIQKLRKREAPEATPRGVLVGMILILAGAAGNIFDSAFYGLIFSESTFDTVATLFPAGGGYASFLHGKVVDMLWFPIVNGTYPGWLPWVGGDPFLFFSPIFNVADSYITCGVLYLLIFQNKFFR